MPQRAYSGPHLKWGVCLETIPGGYDYVKAIYSPLKVTNCNLKSILSCASILSQYWTIAHSEKVNFSQIFTTADKLNGCVAPAFNLTRINRGETGKIRKESCNNKFSTLRWLWVIFSEFFTNLFKYDIICLLEWGESRSFSERIVQSSATDRGVTCAMTVGCFLYFTEYSRTTAYGFIFFMNN